MSVGPDTEVGKVITAIRAAFPTERSSALIAALAEPGGHPETDEIRDLLGNKDWNSVKDSVYLASYPSPFVMGESLIVHYLPGLLCAALRESEGNLADRLVTDFLRPPASQSDFSKFRRRFSGLSETQKRSVAQFLRYCRDVLYVDAEFRARIDDSISRFWDV